MRRSRSRRLVALAASAALLASLTMATVAAPVAAANKVKCQGQVATIVGTDKGERIVGTNRSDVIAARGGNDIIIGGGGNDLICGGTGRDRLVGRAGRDRLYGNGGPDRLLGGNGSDRLFGGVGNDLLAGQVGNDVLGGGPGTDTCFQGAGTGPEVSCELPLPPTPLAPPPAADLAVEITNCINCAISHQTFGVDVRVTNNGPDPVPYVLSHALAPVAGWAVGVDVACETITDTGGSKPPLAVGGVADFSYVAKCIDLRDTDAAGIEVVFSVQVAHDGSDVPDTNNADTEQFEILYGPAPA